MTNETEQKDTSTIRISTKNIERLISLAGMLQMETSKMKALDDAIDYLFDKLNEKETKQ